MAIKTAYDLMIKAVKGIKFFHTQQEGPPKCYEILDLFYDSSVKEDPFECWYLNCKNLKTGEKERLSLVTLRFLVSGGKIESKKLEKIVQNG